MCVSKRQCLSSLVPFSLTFHVPPQQLPVHEVLVKGSVAPATPERRKAAVPKDQLKSQEEEGEACALGNLDKAYVTCGPTRAWNLLHTLTAWLCTHNGLVGPLPTNA